MLDQSVSAIPSSLWTSFSSCFTPTVLFLVLNLMIATIALISSLTRHPHPQPHPPQPHDHVSIVRSPSIIQRLKSINFYRSFHEPPLSSLLHKPSTDYSQFQTLLSAHHNLHEDHNDNVNNSNDDGGGGGGGVDYFTHEQNQQIDAQFDGSNPPANEEENGGDEFQTMDEIYSKLKGVQFGRTKSDREPGSNRNPPRIRKSASMKPSAAAFGRSEKTEAQRPAAVREKVLAKVTDGDAEVDAKADDFINRFRQQLKIQRLDSILKYKDKIRAGFGGR